ncbi:DUF6233 domain-containing protein [Streptomyces sp. NPDC015125]|uniref:DUF6233 domain-containing protein n=1 Tax=Streptomyces sp. NPDC015125 TaxID=3364938 RepID=UPI0036F79CE2
MSSCVPPPPIWVILPDEEQKIRGRLHERRQTRSTWLHKVGLPMWSATEHGAKPVEYVVWLETEHVRPVTGVSYSSVPTVPLPAPTPPPARWGWRVQRLPHRTGGILVHDHDCPNAPQGGEELDLDDALTALRRPGASACQRCDAAAALTPLA